MALARNQRDPVLPRKTGIVQHGTRRIAIIGNGSSGIQILPQMQPNAAKAVTYVRSATWIAANFAAESIPEGKNFQYTEEQKKRFREDPEELFRLRKTIENGFNKQFLTFIRHSPHQAAAYQAFKEISERSIRTQGSTEEFDIIVCATGFDTTFSPSWDQWRENPAAYFGICAANMPNYFIFNGPNCPVGHGSLLAAMETTAEWILRWCKKIAREDIQGRR